MNKFESKSYDEIKDKWIHAEEELSVEEISVLFGLIEAQKDRLRAIRKLTRFDDK